MRFEHLIEINSSAPGMQGAVAVFTREQLWLGLMAKVMSPGRFENGPQACECSDEWSDGGGGLVRRAQTFGPHVLRDEVRLTPQERLQFTPEPHGETTPIGLTITIEEPQAGQMVLRFVYEALAPLSPQEAYFNAYRQSAWLHHDRDMVSTLRQWLESGELSA